MQFKQVENPRGTTIIIDSQAFVFAPLSLGAVENSYRHYRAFSQMMSVQ